ncbi:hypothetical protein DL96DRAFT_1643464, partial [Flagelloscypha sp. PMI_526]
VIQANPTYSSSISYHSLSDAASLRFTYNLHIDLAFTCCFSLLPCRRNVMHLSSPPVREIKFLNYLSLVVKIMFLFLTNLFYLP